MGARGPRKTPKAILRLRGSWRGKAEPGEVEAPDGIPAPPEFLGTAGREEWQRVSQLLASMGTLTLIDANALARYCALKVEWHVANEFIRTNGQTYQTTTMNGTPKIETYPQVEIMLRISVLLSKLESDFGMTAAARSGLIVKAPKKAEEEKNEKARLFA